MHTHIYIYIKYMYAAISLLHFIKKSLPADCRVMLFTRTKTNQDWMIRNESCYVLHSCNKNVVGKKKTRVNYFQSLPQRALAEKPQSPDRINGCVIIVNFFRAQMRVARTALRHFITSASVKRIPIIEIHFHLEARFTLLPPLWSGVWYRVIRGLYIARKAASDSLVDSLVDGQWRHSTMTDDV